MAGNSPWDGVDRRSTFSQPTMKNNGAARVLSIVVPLVAAVALYLGTLISNNATTANRDLTRMSHQLGRHETLQGHSSPLQEIAAIKVTFKEVETQFKGLREIMNIRFELLAQRVRDGEMWQADHDLRVRGLNSAQWERIRALERELYGAAGDPGEGAAPGS